MAKNLKSVTDKEKIKRLKEACMMLLGAVPSGWVMPIGYDKTVAQVENILDQIK